MKELIDILIRKGRKKKGEQDKLLILFADKLIELQKGFDSKYPIGDWCYILEGYNLVRKGQFGYVQNNLINECRKRGFLPIDFVLEDESRRIHNVYSPETEEVKTLVLEQVDVLFDLANYHRLPYWEDEKYFIQMGVEKKGLMSVFGLICKRYNVQLANFKGWSDMNLFNNFAKSFKEMEKKGKIPVLFFFGDHDPKGLQISDKIKKLFYDYVRGTGWNPENLIVDRIGLNFDFIEKHDLMWIDNLESSSGKNPKRDVPGNFKDKCVRDYVSKFGERKVEANAILKVQEIVRNYLAKKIESYLGKDALFRFQKLKDDITEEYKECTLDLVKEYCLDS